jgi:hypothetical protein
LISADECKDQERRYENVRRRRCRQGAEVGKHEPCKPEGRKYEEAAGERRASPPHVDNGLEIAGLGEEIGDLRHLDHEERMVITVVARPNRVDLPPFIANRTQRKIDGTQRRHDKDRGKEEGAEAGPRNPSPHRLNPCLQRASGRGA